MAILWSKPACQALARMPRPWARRLVRAMEAFAADPASRRNDQSVLEGSQRLRRLRVSAGRLILTDRGEDWLVTLAAWPAGPARDAPAPRR